MIKIAGYHLLQRALLRGNLIVHVHPSEGLLGVVVELLHLLLDDPPLVVAGAVVVGVHEDAVQVPPYLVLLPQDPVKLGRSELLHVRSPRLKIEIFL